MDNKLIDIDGIQRDPLAFRRRKGWIRSLQLFDNSTLASFVTFVHADCVAFPSRRFSTRGIIAAGKVSEYNRLVTTPPRSLATQASGEDDFTDKGNRLVGYNLQFN